MKVQVFSTGKCRVKEGFIKGKGKGLIRKLRIPLGKSFAPWMPVNCYVIEHPEGNFLIDTGETLEGRDYVAHPPLNKWFIKNSSEFSIEPEMEIGPLLEKAGYDLGSFRVIVTHLHQDHMDGLKYFSNKQIWVHDKEYDSFFKPFASLNGYMKKSLPENFQPNLFSMENNNNVLGQEFPESYSLTGDGSIQVIPLPGHSFGHVGILLKEEDQWLLFSGDLAFSQEVFNQGIMDGVSSHIFFAKKSRKAVKNFMSENKVLLLPSHDVEAKSRLESRMTAVK